VWLITFFWAMTPRHWVIDFRYFEGTMFLRNAGDWLPDDSATYPRRSSPRDGLRLLSGTNWDFIYNLDERQSSNAGISPQKHWFDPSSVLVSFVVDQVTMGQVSLRVLFVLIDNLIPPILQTHLCVNVSFSLSEGQTGEALKLHADQWFFDFREVSA